MMDPPPRDAEVECGAPADLVAPNDGARRWFVVALVGLAILVLAGIVVPAGHSPFGIFDVADGAAPGVEPTTTSEAPPMTALIPTSDPAETEPVKGSTSGPAFVRTPSPSASSPLADGADDLGDVPDEDGAAVSTTLPLGLDHSGGLLPLPITIPEGTVPPISVPPIAVPGVTVPPIPEELPDLGLGGGNRLMGRGRSASQGQRVDGPHGHDHRTRPPAPGQR